MKDVYWLASYPKSGNTWMRILIGCIKSGSGGDFDINEIIDRGGMTGLRFYFEETSLIDADLFTNDEIDELLPALYGELSREEDEFLGEEGLPVRFVKAHDAYTKNRAGEPLLGGAHAAKGAILIVRDPRDIAPSLANHINVDIDKAISFLNEPASAFGELIRTRMIHLRQKLLDWSGHTKSWLDQRDLPVHLVRYEDLKRDAPGTLIAAMRFAGIELAPENAARAAALAAFANLQQKERETGFFERPSHGPARLFFRRGEAGGWRDELSPQQVARIEAAHAPVMARLGYDVSNAAAKGEAV